jgi:hypothetical protein
MLRCGSGSAAQTCTGASGAPKTPSSSLRSFRLAASAAGARACWSWPRTHRPHPSRRSRAPNSPPPSPPPSGSGPSMSGARASPPPRSAEKPGFLSMAGRGPGRECRKRGARPRKKPLAACVREREGVERGAISMEPRGLRGKGGDEQCAEWREWELRGVGYTVLAALLPVTGPCTDSCCGAFGLLGRGCSRVKTCNLIFLLF